MAHAWKIQYLLERNDRAKKLILEAYDLSNKNNEIFTASLNRALPYPFNWVTAQSPNDEATELLTQFCDLYYDLDGWGPKLGHRLGSLLATLNRILPDLELILEHGDTCAFSFTREDFPHVFRRPENFGKNAVPCQTKDPIFYHENKWYCCGAHHPLGKVWQDGGVPGFVDDGLAREDSEAVAILQKNLDK